MAPTSRTQIAAQKARRTAAGRSTTAASDIPSLYTSTERAVLANYLGLADPAPLDLANIDISVPVDPDEWNEATGGIAPLASDTHNDDLMLENVVARICLQPVERRLPPWAVISGGEVSRGREQSSRRRSGRRRRLRPRHLFTINWGDSGPGFSWPEAYYVTRLPGYDAAVVTASADSPDTNGYCDFAIGWFRPTRRQLDEVRLCVMQRWSGLRGYCQEPWAYLFETGAGDSQTAESWADAVWPDRGTEEDVEE